MDQLIILLIIIGIISLIMFFQFINQRNSDRLYIQKLNDEFDNVRLSTDQQVVKAEGYYLRHREYGQLDDITWNDLSMNEVFGLLNRTQSSIGEDILYYLLRTPITNQNEINKRQEAIEFWISNEKLRNECLLALHHIGKKRRNSIYNCLEKIDNLPDISCKKYIAWVLLLILTFIPMYFFPGVGIVAFLIVLTHNLVLFYSDRRKIADYIETLDMIIRIVKASALINEKVKATNSLEDEDFGLAELSKIKYADMSFGVVGDSNPISLIINLIGSIFFFELIRFSICKSFLQKNKNNIDRMIFNTGSYDAYISLAGYVKSMDGKLCKPEEGDVYSAKALFHPLISNPVCNDIVTTKSILLTGANASGKSTFLKSIALSVLMGQTIGFVCAKELHAPKFILLSSMSISDDISKGDSYYMAEIKSIKRIIDANKPAKDKGLQLICFVDELLRGTNTTERIAASSQIIDYLDKEGAFVCAATHELELTQILKSFDNYHFEEEMSDGDIIFSYLLKEGAANSRNAISLLGRAGFDKTICDNATSLVAKYTTEGKWI